MRQCQVCSGLVPEAVESCPNCVVTARRGGLRSMAMKGLVALTVSSCGTPMALYGVPCTAQNGCNCDAVLPDGGSPKKDPSNPCYSPDGGTP